jgi:uncharacterized protein involved in type VI secretion and phage assembly
MTAAARARSTDRRYYGVVEAIVVEVDDTEGREGRVKVKFPWFDDNMVTEWCRVQQAYAGNGYGAFFVPEQGDEVLVAFIHGDMRLPIVLGGLYNGQDKPPSYRDGTNKNEKLIRTKGNHEILLDDSQGNEKVRVKTQAGHEVTLDDVAKSITVATPAGAKVLLEDQGSKITVQVGSQSVTLEPAGVTVSATGTAKVQASSVEVTAPSVVLGSSAGQPLINATFMAAFNAHTHICTAPGAPSGPPIPPMVPPMMTTLTRAS